MTLSADDLARAKRELLATPTTALGPPVTVHHPKCAIFDKAHERGYVVLDDCTCGGSAFQVQPMQS